LGKAATSGTFDPMQATQNGPLVGQSLRRLEDHRFLTGQGRYTDDIRVDDEAQLVVVRSPHAHAVLVAIHADAARSMPGVLGVFTHADLAALAPIPCKTPVKTVGPLHVPPRPALACGRVRHAGEPVAFVVAETLHRAMDAAELIGVEYDTLPAVTEGSDALAAGAPQLWEGVPGNQAFLFQKGDRAATEAALAGAAHVIDLTLVNNRLIVAPVEHRNALATHADGRFELLLSGQGVHEIRNDLATILGIEAGSLEVRSPDVGGGFGVKNGVYPEYVGLLWAARALGRPVRWHSTHGEDFLSSAHARDNVSRARLGVDAQGRFLALLVETVANLGSAMATGGPGSSTNAPGNAMGTGYAILHVSMTVRGAFTNTVPIDAYRGAGKPEANYLMERLVDAAAERLGIDRVELRRRNLVRDFPHPTAMATTIEAGRFAENLDPALALADVTGFAGRRAASESRGLKRGLGITCFMETARGAPGEGAEVRFVEDSVELRLGSQSNGQGHETAFPQIAADLLGLPVAAFRYMQADTRTVRKGHGHGGARSLHMGGQAMVQAIDSVLEKARPIAARLLQATAVSWTPGTFHAGDRSVSIQEVARAEPGALDSYFWTPLDLITFPNGVHVAEVEIDPATGHVTLARYSGLDDYGTVINPMLLEGQIHGGLAQGIGQAMSERTVYDSAGQLLTGSFMDYAIPRAADLPWLDVQMEGVPSAANRLGVKGAGQSGAIAAPQAVIAAALDALRPLGVHHIDMPLTPERVWQAIRSAT
jgi:carbon-monoxide dehydrogenase large subunit